MKKLTALMASATIVVIVAVIVLSYDQEWKVSGVEGGDTKIWQAHRYGLFGPEEICQVRFVVKGKEATFTVDVFNSRSAHSNISCLEAYASWRITQKKTVGEKL